MVRDLLLPVALGALLALLLHPLQRRLTPRLGRFAGWAPTLLTLGAFVLIIIPFAFIAAQVVTGINSFLSQDLNGALNGVQQFGDRFTRRFGDRFAPFGGNLRSEVGGVVQRIGTAIAGLASSFASSLPGQILDVFIFVLALFYFLRDGSRLVRWLLSLSPFRDRDTDELFASIHETVHGAIIGQLATSVVQGGLTILVLFVFKVPGALLFGIIATLLSIIPMVGTTPVTVGAVIYLLIINRFGAAVGMGISAAVIGISDNIVRPYVQSSQSRLHPLLILLGIFGGLQVFGAAGVFIGPVVAAMAVWAVDIYARFHRHPLASVRALPPPPDSGSAL
jgi:predicted PurR-regulated permease PerM